MSITSTAPPKGAYSIREFSEAHGLSEAMFFKLQKQGLAPAVMAVGSRRLISIEAAEKWRREREEEAAAIAAAAEQAESDPMSLGVMAAG
jgi:hypothetical protein